MLGASKRLLHLKNAGGRFYQRSVSINRVLSYRIRDANSTVHRGVRLDLPVSREIKYTFSTLSGSKLDAVNAEEAGIAGTSVNTECVQKDSENGVQAEPVIRKSSTNRFYRYREERFRNYSSSDYQSAEALRKDFQKLMENSGIIEQIDFTNSYHEFLIYDPQHYMYFPYYSSNF